MFELTSRPYLFMGFIVVLFVIVLIFLDLKITIDLVFVPASQLLVDLLLPSQCDNATMEFNL